MRRILLALAGVAAALGLTAGAASADAGPPNVVGLTATPLSRVDRAVYLEWSSDQTGVTYTCRLDKFTLDPCSSPMQYTGAEGVHTLEVAATNAAGVTGPTSKVSVRIVDTRIVGGPADGSYTNATSASFSFEGGPSYTCNVDMAGWLPCPSKLELQGLAEGSHLLWVRARYDDVAYDRVPAIRHWYVDTTPPETTLSGDTPPFAFSANEPATFACSVDGEPWGPCASPRAVTGMAPGFHAFEVKAIDRAGNEDPAPAQHVWFVRGAILPAPSPAPMPTKSKPLVSDVAALDVAGAPELDSRYRNGRFTRLAVTGLPAGTRVPVTVTSPDGALRTFSLLAGKGPLSLKPLIGKRLAPGTRIVVAGKTITIRRGRSPKLS